MNIPYSLCVDDNINGCQIELESGVVSAIGLKALRQYAVKSSELRLFIATEDGDAMQEVDVSQ